MQETVRIRQDHEMPALGGSGDPFAAGDGSGMAVVSHWPYSERLAVAGLTVQQVRDRYRDRFDLHPQSQAILDGNHVADDIVIGENAVLMFVRRAGEKGWRSGGWRAARRGATR